MNILKTEAPVVDCTRNQDTAEPLAVKDEIFEIVESYENVGTIADSLLDLAASVQILAAIKPTGDFIVV